MRTPFVQRDQWDQWRREAAQLDYVTRSFAIINSATHVTRENYLEQIYDMDGDFPDRGWKENGAKLYGWYFKRGLKLKEVPSSSIKVELTEGGK